jgi:hypothetical protein
METRQIPHEQWQAFFSNFSHVHRGEHVNVETIGADASGVEFRCRDRPLVGIAAAQPRAGREEWIDVIARDASGGRATHCIVEPLDVRLAEEKDRRAVALQIESADGSITIVRFEPSAENMPPGFIV